MAKIDSVKSLGYLVRQERISQGYTQTEMAELCGVGLTYVSNLENGKETAEIGKALHILRMLGLDLHADRRSS